jgi:hypothetical protein
MEKSDLQNILSELTNINLVILGISITIFTVVYSFIVNKRNDLETISDKLNQQINNPFIIKQRHFTLKYIKQFSSINTKFLHLIISTSFLFICLFAFNRFLLETFHNLKELFCYTFCGLTAFIIIYFIYVFVDLIRKYTKEVAL